MKVFCKPISAPLRLPPGVSGADPAGDPSALGSLSRIISILNNPCKYKHFFPMNWCLFLIILHSWSLQISHFNVILFLKDRFLKGFLYLCAIPVSDGISKAGARGRNYIFFQFWWLLFPNYQAASRQTLLQAAGFLGLLRTARAKWQQEVCEQLMAAVAEHAARAC